MARTFRIVETEGTDPSTAREWLVANGLTQKGSRGRFSLKAIKALDAAIKAGATFEDYPNKPKPQKVERVTEPYDAASVREWAAQNGIHVGERGRIATGIVAQYLRDVNAGKFTPTERTEEKAERPKVEVKARGDFAKPIPVQTKVRNKNIAYAIWDGAVVGISNCAKGHAVVFCACDGGPVIPAYMGGGTATFEKPVV